MVETLIEEATHFAVKKFPGSEILIQPDYMWAEAIKYSGYKIIEEIDIVNNPGLVQSCFGVRFIETHSKFHFYTGKVDQAPTYEKYADNLFSQCQPAQHFTARLECIAVEKKITKVLFKYSEVRLGGAPSIISK